MLAVLAGAALLFILPVLLRQIRADRLSSDPTVENLRRAIALQPDRAEFYNQLGEIYLYSVAAYDPVSAVAAFRQAVERNPGMAAYRLNLARAYEAGGNFEESARCVEEARRLDALNPALAWAQGNAYAVGGKTVPALEAWRDAMAGDRQYAAHAFELGWKLAPDPKLLVDHLIPSQQAMDLRFLEFLARNGADASPAWQRIVRRGETFEAAQIRVYLESLISSRKDPDARRRDFDLARHVWRQALPLIAPETPLDPGNLIHNGGFEHELLEVGFAWRRLPVDGASITFDHQTYFEGRRSLRVDFDGSANVNFAHFCQVVAVEPGKRHVLTARLRADRISGGSGPRLVVIADVIPGPTALLLEGREVIHSAGWVEDRVEFVVPSSVYVLRVLLARPVSRKISSKIAGSVWLDAVSLRVLEERP
jgi:tetratricopeptide (TPR) repeat protein